MCWERGAAFGHSLWTLWSHCTLYELETGCGWCESPAEPSAPLTVRTEKLGTVTYTFTWNAVYTHSAIKASGKKKDVRVVSSSLLSLLRPEHAASCLRWATFGLMRCRKLLLALLVQVTVESFCFVDFAFVCTTRVHGQVDESAVGGWIPSLLESYDHSGGEEAARVQTQAAVFWERRTQIAGSLGNQPEGTGGCKNNQILI